MERTYSTVEARANFSQLVTEAGYVGREAIIQRNNRPVAVLIGYEQYLEWQRQMEERATRFTIYDEIRTRNLEAEPEAVEADVTAALEGLRNS